MLLDRAKIHVEGGRGGNGVVSFRREAHVPRGGPDGGDGGHGGDVVLLCDVSRNDLGALGRSRHFRAGRGEHGKGKQRHGGRGEDVILRVPPGTVVETLDGGEVELLTGGQRVVVAAGGSGGHGNKRFASSTRQAPRFAEKGLEGESGTIELRLKLLADAGLVGQPNAGKSSLLAALTRANPKVADYPFTTTEPVLGTIETDERQVVLADIPGLIEGAAEGAGLGHEFLAHVERNRLLLHVVDIAPDHGDPATAYEAVRAELSGYGHGLEALPELIVLSKRDLVPDEDAERAVADWRARLGDGPWSRALEVVALSSATGAGLDQLRGKILELLPEQTAAAVSSPAGESEFEAEHRTYRPGEDEGFEVAPAGRGAFRITGRGIEMLVSRHDLTNQEALGYLEQRLREIGVIAALERAGFEPGDEVQVGEVAFELRP